MEKLIELLNEFIKEKKHYHWTFEDENDVSKYECLIIFKQFWFIKWLVENDKIDRKKIEKNQIYQSCLALLIDRWFYKKVLLMLLSISDTPIEDLISYLK